MKRAAVCFSIAALVGCRVEAIDGTAYVGPANRCELGCPSGSSCVDGACLATETSYPLMLEATPPSSARYAPGVTFSLGIDDRKGGARDLALPDVALVSARLLVPGAASTVPLTLRLQRVDGTPGTPARSYETRSFPNTSQTPTLAIPPGDYYVFVSPSDAANLALVPPVQLRDDSTGKPLVVTFSSGAHELQVSIASSLRTLSLHLTDESGNDFTSLSDARKVYVFDETSGAVASTVVHTCVEPGKSVAFDLSLTLAPALDGHRYTLRLEPDADKPCNAKTSAVRPTIDYDLSALDVEGKGNTATIALHDPSSYVTVLASGTITAFGSKSGLGIEDGTIILRSTALSPAVAPISGHASIVITQPFSRGAFVLLAPPGNYRATIIPSSAVTSTTAKKYAVCVDCTVPSQDETAVPGTRVVDFAINGLAPLTFEIAPLVAVNGQPSGFDGALFTLGTFEATTSTSTVGFTDTGTALVTRAQSGLVTLGTNGANLNSALDPGYYDLIVRTPERSGYPWIVRPRLQVKPAATLSLGAMTASAPVVFSGRVVDPTGTPLPGSTVRARALVTDNDPTKPPLGAVLVGETRADDAGNYRIVVPATLSNATAIK